jgi:DNA phosphorothioation-dependent restriction protein DptH
MSYTYLAQALSTLLEKHITTVLDRNADASVRPVLVGPPAEALETLFNLLTTNGTSDWRIATINQDIVVLYVQGPFFAGRASAASASTLSLSKRCQWDYAVTARNNSRIVVMLVEPRAWDNRHESLANTTETLGGLPTELPDRKLRDIVWTHIINQTVQTTGLNINDIRLAFKEIAKQGKNLEPSTRDRALWDIADGLLAIPSPVGISVDDTFALSVGLPSLINTNISIRDAFSLVQELGDLLSSEGLRAGVRRLEETEVAKKNALQPTLKALSDHIRQTSLTGASFAQAPAWYYRPDSTAPRGWWQTLNASLLRQMLDELADKRPDKLELQCTNSLNSFDMLKGEPSIVSKEVELRAIAPSGKPLSSLTFSCRVDKSSYPVLPSGSSSGGAGVDPNPPLHEKPVRYQVETPGFSTGFVEVLALDKFSCKGTARVRDAERQRPPEKKGSGPWRQEIVLARGGPVDLMVYCASGVAEIQVQIIPYSESGFPAVVPSPLKSTPTIPGQSVVVLVVEVEHEDDAEVLLKDGNSSEVGKWTIHFKVEGTSNVAQSYFEALVSAHQDERRGRVAVPKPPDHLLQRLELEYLSSKDSWKPILACWSTEVSGIPPLDWADPRLGDTFPQVDPRPDLNPPQTLLDAREATRQYLEVGRRTFGQIYLGEGELLQKIDLYLQLYRDWLRDAPKVATWFDCIAIHDAKWNQEASRYTAKSEPTAMLLSPLHPLRIAWQCLAQQQLYESLHCRCPAAGLLDPHSCPDIGTWYTLEGATEFVPRVFFTVASENPYWAVLLSKDALDPLLQERMRVVQRLSELGVSISGVVGGFSISQTRNSLEEVTRLLPARATLRLGIVGTREASSASARGVIDWCDKRYDRAENEGGITRSGMPVAVDVYDMRGEVPYPSPEQIATLSENVQEKVKWFKRDKMEQGIQLDLVILDQLGTGSPKGWHSDARSPVGHGALYRIRIREDFQDAVWLDESRVGRVEQIASNFAELLQGTAKMFEELAALAGVSQFRFEPNRQAIGSRLDEATFLAVTSTQIDPASIIRGAKGQGYVWDYVLPDALGGDEESAGYYLIAEPLQAMKNAIKKAVKVVTSSLPSDSEVQVLLDEISRRGIPILKRLASGGSQSRGELGMLLAVRLLQDAFQEGALTARLPVWDGECIHLLLPADPYQKPFDRVRKALQISDTEQRPDLLVIAVHVPPALSNTPAHLKITPVEVKFRSGQMSENELKDALWQAANLGEILSTIWSQKAQTSLWDTCGIALLAQCLNLAFRIYADKNVHRGSPTEWTKIHEKVLMDVLSKRAIVEVDKAGRLLVFDDSSSSAIRDTNRDGQYDTIVLNRDDAKVLLTGTGNLSPDGEASVRVLGFSLPGCDNQKSTPSASASTAQAPSPMTATAPRSLVEEQEKVSLLGLNTNSTLSETAHVSATAFPVEAGQNTVSNLGAKSVSHEDTTKKVVDEHPVLSIPRAFIGWTEPTSRWSFIGKLDTTGEFVGLDLDHPKTIGIFGYMGSGKSYLVGNLIESALAPISGINVLSSPLSVVIFNYRRNMSDRFEMSSLALPNRDKADVERLAAEYSALPQALQDIHVLCLPGELDELRKKEYGGLVATELFFDPSTLTIEDWELLMGEPGSDALFARTIRHVLGELRLSGGITLERLEEHVLSLLSGQSRRAAEIRFRFVQKHVSPTRGVRFEQILGSGRAVIVDLRNRSLFSKEDALRFFLVCANHVSRVQGRFNKVVIFDEAHEYLSNEFGESIAARIRLMRHDGTSYIFATQDVESIPPAIRRFVATKFVFSLGSRQNVEDLLRFAPEFKNLQLVGIRPGYCLVQTDQSMGNMFERPRLVSVRPRVTQHGGATQIFSTNAYQGGV